MKLNYDKILERANEINEPKCDLNESFEIRSRQVKSVLRALVEAINEREKESLGFLEQAFSKEFLDKPNP